MKNFLTREQKLLLKLENTNVISSAEDSNSETYEPDIDKQHDNMIEDLWHPSSLHVAFTLGKITKIL